MLAHCLLEPNRLVDLLTISRGCDTDLAKDTDA